MKKIKSIILGILLMASILTVINPVSAATLEVGPGKAYATINAALAVAGNGDTILVYPGTYNESIDITIQNLTLKSTGGRDVTIIGPGTSATVITIRGGLGIITVEGFTVILSDTITNPNGISQGYASGTGTTSYILNNKIKVTKYLRNGIQVSGENSKVIGNIVEGGPLTADWASSGIMIVNFAGYASAKNIILEDNQLLGGMDYGISVIQWYNGGEVSGVTIENNVIEKCVWGGISIGGNVKNTLIKNNIIKNNLYAGVTEDHDFYYGYGGGNPSNTKVNYNEFCNNGIDIEVYGEAIGDYRLDARFNWWCSNAGPRPGSLVGPIDYFPWEKKGELPLNSIMKILTNNNKGEDQQ